MAIICEGSIFPRILEISRDTKNGCQIPIQHHQISLKQLSPFMMSDGCCLV